MKTPRKPVAFRIDPARPDPAANSLPGQLEGKARKPVSASPAMLVESDDDIFDQAEAMATQPPSPAAVRRSIIGAVLAGSFGILVSLALGLWTDRLIRDLFARADWLGWLALAAAIAAIIALLIVFTREMLGLFRLASVEKLSARAAAAIAANDSGAARAIVAELTRLVAASPETARGRRNLEELRDDIIDGRDLLVLAEKEILAPLDARATVLILDAAKRVSVVTAVSPRAVVDIAYVVFETGRLIRRLANLYGGRPGTLGFFRLTRNILAHLAVTGSIAVGDSFVQQIVGQGLAARLSARLGEGVINGMMTARIGLAAMDSVRPLPFTAVKRPGMGHFLSALTPLDSKRTKDGG